MGIGRREFLKLAGVALAGIAVNPLQAVVTNDNVYINKKLGILFHKPDSWGFLNVKDFGKLKDEQILGNGYEEMKDEVWEDLGDPICIATKFPEDLPKYKGVFSPTITLNITPKEELADLECSNFKEVMEMSELGVSMILKDFKVVKRYEPYMISGSEFYEYDSEYLFEHVDISKPLKVELKTLKTEHNGFYYDFNCHQSYSQNQVADKEFAEFKESIKLI
ncbi:hypothetical protein [Maribellus maritimus]|uniref:hypothetical protein n=1 Tax=Maribellus maritimus TaxID=2870838 RepID=UPI001EEB84F5|nr:hypothetical protein [Maribellus maritimus]MCG6191456.1 hypothetical protein [Maribellus maritimus]